MKKPTAKARQWNRIHARELNRRRLDSKRKLKARRRDSHREPLPSEKVGRRLTASSIICPEDFSLQSNFEGVVDVLRQIRERSERQRNEKIYIDFRRIQSLSPTAALVLAAELDRWKKLPSFRGRQLRSVDVKDWNPKVQRQLKDMGFFDLLHVRNPVTIEDKNAPDTDSRYVQFRSGPKVDGQVIEELRELHLDPIIDVPNKRLLFAAVTEAMTNVVHHAYPNDMSYDTLVNHWWLSAAHNAQKKEATILIYDQGAGIPQTLPRKFGERLRELFPKDLFGDDALMIQAAHDLARSATGERNRGHGLQRDIRRYAQELSCHGIYRVTSGKGEYTFEVGLGGNPEEGSETLRTFRRPLNGTLIEWRLTLQ